MAAIEFLEINDILAIHLSGVEIHAKPGELADLTLGVTAGKLEKAGVAKWFGDHQSKSPP